MKFVILALFLSFVVVLNASRDVDVDSTTVRADLDSRTTTDDSNLANEDSKNREQIKRDTKRNNQQMNKDETKRDKIIVSRRDEQTSKDESKRDDVSESKRDNQISKDESKRDEIVVSRRDEQTGRDESKRDDVSESKRDNQISKDESKRDEQTGKDESKRDEQTGRDESKRDEQLSKDEPKKDNKSRDESKKENKKREDELNNSQPKVVVELDDPKPVLAKVVRLRAPEQDQVENIVDEELPRLSAILIVANQSSSIQTTVVADVLRFANFSVIIAGLDGEGPIQFLSNITLIPDASLESVANNDFDVIVLIGGLEGPVNVARSPIVKKMLLKQYKERRLISAICGGVLSVSQNKLFWGRRITTHPKYREDLPNHYKLLNDSRVVHDGNLITSQGPATSFEFALAIVDYFRGSTVFQQIRTFFSVFPLLQ